MNFLRLPTSIKVEPSLIANPFVAFGTGDETGHGKWFYATDRKPQIYFGNCQ